MHYSMVAVVGLVGGLLAGGSFYWVNPRLGPALALAAAGSLAATRLWAMAMHGRWPVPRALRLAVLVGLVLGAADLFWRSPVTSPGGQMLYFLVSALYFSYCAAETAEKTGP